MLQNVKANLRFVCRTWALHVSYGCFCVIGGVLNGFLLKMLSIWTIHRWRELNLVEQYPVFSKLSVTN